MVKPIDMPLWVQCIVLGIMKERALEEGVFKIVWELPSVQEEEVLGDPDSVRGLIVGLYIFFHARLLGFCQVPI